VTNPSPAHLRLHVEEYAGESPAPPVAQLAPLLQAFEQATGWQIRYEQSPAGLGEVWSTTVDGGGDQPAARLVLAGPQATSADQRVTAIAELQQARPLALAIGGLLGELNRLRHALWQREAELAAGVPVVTSNVAAGGVDARAEDDFLVASTSDEQVNAVLRILDNRNERRRLAVAGRTRMLSHHDWGRSMHRLDRIIERCLEKWRDARIKPAVKAETTT